MNLNDEQQRVVEFEGRAGLVLAPAGTGKTRVLAERVVRALRQGVPAERVLCITFTNLAAQQLRARVGEVLPSECSRITVQTFHGLCARILRQEAARIGLPSDFVILDEDDAAELMGAIVKRTPDAAGRKARDILARFELMRSRAGDPFLRLDGVFWDTDFEDACMAEAYRKELADRHALDFADLIYYVRAALCACEDVRARWESMYTVVQVDEVQDTHLAEYDVLRILGKDARICFFGDLDQSIYGWRGARSKEVMAAFEADFSPVHFALELNYRATLRLQEAANRMAEQMASRYTKLVPAASCAEGEPVKAYFAPFERDEADYIAATLHGLDRKAGKVAVLTRTNKHACMVADVLKGRGAEVIAPDAYRFFRRKEIKDATAFLKLVLNPHDVSAAQRVCEGYVGRVGEQSVRDIVASGAVCGLRLCDLFRSDTLTYLDPHGAFLEATGLRDLVVFDTETTGLSVFADRIIELAAVRVCAGKVCETFRKLVRSPDSVAATTHIHGYTDEQLAREGEDAAGVFKAFAGFRGQMRLAGHNVGYDTGILYSHANRCGVDTDYPDAIDTYDLCRRFLGGQSLRLQDLACSLQLPQRRFHQALDDVLATVDLMHVLRPLVLKDQTLRSRIVEQYGHRFEEAASAFEHLRRMSYFLRPRDVFREIDRCFGLRASLRGDTSRLRHLDQMETILETADNQDMAPRDALVMLIHQICLSTSVDHLASRGDAVVCVPVHQAKGLEFDTVFVSGAVDGMFPIFNASDLEEEKRLFYVAITRPRERLYVTGYRTFVTPTGFTFDKKPTPYLDPILR